MFVVIAHTVTHKVKWTIVGIRLLHVVVEHIVLSDKVASDGMGTQSDEGADQEIDHGPPATKVDDGGIKSQLSSPVIHLPDADALGTHQQRAEAVVEGKEKHPNQLPEHTEEVATLKVCGNIHIESRNTLKRVMVKMVLSKLDTLCNAYGQVSKDGQPLVVLKLLERQPMSDLMDGKRHGVVDDASKTVSHQDKHCPALIHHIPASKYLSQDHSKNRPLCHGIITIQLLNFGVFLENFVSPPPVRLIQLGPR